MSRDIVVIAMSLLSQLFLRSVSKVCWSVLHVSAILVIVQRVIMRYFASSSTTYVKPFTSVQGRERAWGVSDGTNNWLKVRNKQAHITQWQIKYTISEHRKYWANVASRVSWTLCAQWKVKKAKEDQRERRRKLKSPFSFNWIACYLAAMNQRVNKVRCVNGSRWK